MADIKITLSIDPKERALNIESEAKWLDAEESLRYPLQGKPRNAEAGCWVYFIRDGRLVARAKVEEFVEIDDEEYTFTGETKYRPGWRVVVKSPMELAHSPFSHRGFRGFRYVRPDEQHRFEEAFS